MTRQPSIPQKANRILKGILVVFVLVLARVWQVAVVQHEARTGEARRFQTRAVPLKPERGIIEDRFHLPLATNRVQYNVAITYAPIREIPRVVKRSGEKHFARKEHIEKLATLLADELQMDRGRIEDLIHSKASLFPNVPYVIRSDLPEETYYRLRMLEREWPGLTAQREMRRDYPQGKVAAEVIGYVGPISREEYLRVADEIRVLKEYIAGYLRGDPVLLPKGVSAIEEAERRLAELQERSYSLQDAVGKGGIEKVCDERLRGFCGKTFFEQDIYGTFLSELPGRREAVHGEPVTLALSVELQRYAEELLAQTERYRDGRSHKFDYVKRLYTGLKDPWIKGGAIVVMDPNSGEVLALASYPRTDANTFIPSGSPEREEERVSQLLRWFETDRHLGEIWDGKRPLERENFNVVTKQFEDEGRFLTFPFYEELALSKEGAVRKGLERVGTIRRAAVLQERFRELVGERDPRGVMNGLYHREGDQPLPAEALSAEGRSLFDPFLASAPTNYEKLLILDLCQLLVDPAFFSRSLMEAVGKTTLADYRTLCQSACVLEGALRRYARELFHDHQFARWRAKNQKVFLKEKRRQEEEAHSYQHPYLDYLDAEERAQFRAFWEGVRWSCVALLVKGPEGPVEIEADFAPYADLMLTLGRELEGGAHRGEPWHGAYEQLRAFLAPHPFSIGCEWLATVRPFAELSRPLWGHYRYLRGKPGHQVERDLAAAFYPRYGFGYGRSHAYRQATIQGSVFKFVPAFEALMQRHEKLAGRAAPISPFTMVDDVHKGTGNQWNVGFTLEGKAISQRYKGGKLLRTHRRHVGKIDLVKALETSSNSYFGILAVDHIEDPEDLNRRARQLSYGARTGIELPGEYAGRLPDDLATNRTGLYSYVDGQHTLVVTPLQTAVMLSALVNGGRVFKPQIFKGEAEVVRQLEIPDAVRRELLEGMRLAVQGEQGGARPSVIRSYQEAPWIVQDYRALYKQIVGKTSTSEAVETVDLDPFTGTNTYNHIWFAGVSFKPEEITGTTFGRPELVVVVYLKYGDYGREAAPLAAQMIKKWRSLQE
ncbi:MAG: penicillin-binding transpeptidase domain-containing protein [Parachlamydiales bacterium]